VDAIIQHRLNKKGDKGIVLLHGLPGTGKTTYLRYLIGRLKKRVLFLSPNVAGNLMDPDFIDLLIDNPQHRGDYRRCGEHHHGPSYIRKFFCVEPAEHFGWLTG
jgi:predicted alpha/beta-fold hydrolase